MFRNLKIGTKVVIIVITLIFIAVLSESTVSYYRTKNALRDSWFSRLEILTNNFIENVDNYFSFHENSLRYFQESIPREQVNALNKYIIQDDKDTVLLWVQHFKEKHFSPFFSVNNFDDLYLINNNGVILYQHTNWKMLGHQFRNVDHDIIDTHLPKFHVNKPIWEKDGFYFYTTTPVKNANDEVIASVVCKKNVSSVIKECTPKNQNSIKTLEFTALKKYKNEIFEIGTGENNTTKLSSNSITTLINSASDKLNGKGEFSKNKNDKTKILYLWKFSHEYELALIAKIQSNEAFYELGNFTLFTLLIGIIILFTSFLLSLFFSRVLTLPMIKLKKVLGLVSNGVLPRELQTPLKDEIGEMITIVNKIVKSLKSTAAFAHAIGDGKFKTNFKPISNKDILGHALVNMRESLQKADKKDLLRNWIITGNAEISEILRDNDSLDKLGDEILEYICNKIDAIQGAFYLVTDENIEVTASFAFNKKKYITKKFKLAEGLIGQAAVEKDIIIRTEIPDDYMYISSGLMGDKKPKCLLIIPLIYNDNVFGLIELAGFQLFDEDKVLFMKEISEIIARTIFNLRVNENTRKLLQESQRMSSELQEQQKELQRNAHEMQKAQEDLKLANKELENQFEEVNNAQNRIQALLQNASEVITIYSKDKIIKYVSPSVESILGYRENDLLKLTDFQHLDESGQVAFSAMFNKLLEIPESRKTIEVAYFKKNGDKIWLEATGKNMLSEPAIKGIIVNYRDITERKRAEEEERKRGQMQALSENSPDLITRVSLDGNFFYINPTITTLTGSNPDDFLNKRIEDLNLPEEVIAMWLEIIDSVHQTKDKITAEFPFPTLTDNRVMLLNAIPEFNKEGSEIESILMVSHDVTERKQAEIEIQEKNKKINDSINYAEIIQETILPNNDLIRKDLPNSFIYFKPRDIVSGDFPWYYKKGNDIYLAAVDCTGHGVPGALISLVGYFLLNNIIENNDVKNPGELLTLLDRLIIKTFRQDQDDSKIKDGMDVAVCKINLESKTVEYAGANRPLYFIKESGVLNEIKGDKFPIGGGNAYVNKTDFTNSIINFESGDSIYFFSDGLPDQFGGPDGTTKFGTGRIKKLLQEKHTLSIHKLAIEVDNSITDWKMSEKQTDDIIMMGIKF